jgi:beta-lactamase regulating signal transducer with metallopeptidase domain
VQAIIQSAFLQALAQGLIASIWQMAILWLTCLLLMKLFTFSSAQKFNIAFIAQLSGLVLFFYTVFNTYNDPQANWPLPVFTNTALFDFNSALIIAMPYLAILYIAVFIFKLNRFGFTYAASKKLKCDDLIKMPAESRLFVQQMTELLSIHKKVKIYLSKKINCPLTIGFLKPVILIPVAAVNNLTTQQMEAVILHELAHIKRADYLLFILQSLVDKIFFFNIFSIMLSNIIEKERENACDDWVIQFRYNSMHYAEALFKLGRLKAIPVLAMPLSGKKESLLLGRIKRLLHNQNKNFYSARSIWLSFFSVAIIAFVCLLPYCKAVETAMPVAARTFTPASPTQNVHAVFNEPVAAVADTKPVQQAKKITKEKEQASSILDKQAQLNAMAAKMNDGSEAFLEKQNYLVQVQQKVDSIQSRLQIEQAINSQVLVTPEIMQKATSYKNFKQIEHMLAASGDSIKVTESEASKNNYQKQITIESIDKNGNKHVYSVVIQLYQ